MKILQNYNKKILLKIIQIVFARQKMIVIQISVMKVNKINQNTP